MTENELDLQVVEEFVAFLKAHEDQSTADYSDDPEFKRVFTQVQAAVARTEARVQKLQREDDEWAQKARESEASGFVGTDAAEKLLRDARHE